MQKQFYIGIKKNIFACGFSIFLLLTTAKAQDNSPYSCFGYKHKSSNEHVSGIHIQNPDTLSTSKSIRILPPKGIILLLDYHDDILISNKITPQDLYRFVSPDPHEQKYPYLSPYSSFADNPIIVIDPDGRDIIIRWGGKGGYLNMTYTYQKDRVFDENTPRFVKNTITALDHLYATGAMKIQIDPKNKNSVDILETFMKDKGQSLIIMPGKQNEFFPQINTVNFQDRLGIEFRKDLDLNWTEENTGRNSPAGLLAHEIIHAFNDIYWFDTYDKRRTTKVGDTDKQTLYFPNEEELYTTGLANQALKVLGEDPRTHYLRNYYPVVSPISTVKKEEEDPASTLPPTPTSKK